MLKGRDVGRVALAAIYGVAGVFHLATPEPFLLITPAWVPFPHAVILGTGLCELAGAVGLLTRSLRAAAGFGLALYAICVFPANIKHALDGACQREMCSLVGGIMLHDWRCNPFWCGGRCSLAR